MALLPRTPRFPRKLGDDDWLRKRLAETAGLDKRDYLNAWTTKPEKEPNDGPHPKTDRSV